MFSNVAGGGDAYVTGCGGANVVRGPTELVYMAGAGGTMVDLMVAGPVETIVITAPPDRTVAAVLSFFFFFLFFRLRFSCS